MKSINAFLITSMLLTGCATTQYDRSYIEDNQVNKQIAEKATEHLYKEYPAGKTTIEMGVNDLFGKTLADSLRGKGFGIKEGLEVASENIKESIKDEPVEPKGLTVKLKYFADEIKNDSSDDLGKMYRLMLIYNSISYGRIYRSSENGLIESNWTVYKGDLLHE